MFNEREKLILQVLLKNNEQLSIKEIAKATKIKERTLYREIKNLESSLQALDIDLIKEKSKYYLSGNIESLDSAQFETSFEDYAYSTETRLTLILCFLILNEDTSIKDISEKLMLSYNTVASTIAKGTLSIFAIVRAIRVFPVPVCPTIMILLFCISISSSSWCCNNLL